MPGLRVYRALRKRLHTACQAQRPMFGVVEGDESLSGARRGEAKRGRGAVGKTTVSGLFAREGQVYTEVVPGCKKATLSRQYWKEGRSFQGRIRQRRCSYQGPGRLWGVAKGGLSKVRGVPDRTVHLPLEETEWRDNNRHSSRYKLRLTGLRQNPLKFQTIC